MESFGLSTEDLQEDFDPASYDAAMGKVFDAEYYECQGGDEGKPVFSDLEGVSALYSRLVIQQINLL